MRKIIGIILTFIILISFPACGSDKIEESSSTSEKTVSAVSSEVSEKSDIKAVSSSAANPLELESWGRCAKFSVSEQKYFSVPVRLMKVQKGTQAKKQAEEYLKEYDEYKGITRPDNDSQWVVLDYEIMLDGFPMDENGADASISSMIMSDEGENIKVGDDVFIPVTVNIYDDETAFEGTVKGSIAFVMPKSCKTFLAVLGETGEENAFVKCTV